jgi:hypothetical protein
LRSKWFYRWLPDSTTRRYTEVATEREKALAIKTKADEAALELSRASQTYKDEKANELRTQIESERGHYLTRPEYNTQHQALIDKIDAEFKPLNEFMLSQLGAKSGVSEARSDTSISRTFVVALVGVGVAVLGLFVAIAAVAATVAVLILSGES